MSTPLSQDDPLFAAPGRVAALMRTIDWSSTPLGPSESWSSCLRCTLGMMLNSPHPMFLFWGEDARCFYNDAYLPSFDRDRHTSAMGQPGVVVWPDAWDTIEPQIRAARNKEPMPRHEDHLVPVRRQGRMAQVYWTYSYTCVPETDGSAGGALAVCTETTASVLGRRRSSLIQRLSKALERATETTELFKKAAAQLVSDEQSDIGFVLLYQGSTAPHLAVAQGLPSSAAADIDTHLAHQMDSLVRAGSTVPLPRALYQPMADWPDAIETVYVAEIGLGASVGCAVFGLNPGLPFNSAYRDFLDQIGSHIARSHSRIDTLRIRAIVESERNQLLELAPIATAILAGPEHIFRLANPKYMEMLQGEDDLIGRTYLDVFPQLVDHESSRILDHVYETGEPYANPEMLFSVELPDGTPVDHYVSFALQPIRDSFDDVVAMMTVVVDVTESVVARKTLEANDAERNRLVSELEAASRAKDEFLAMLGHELRNPLSPIMTAVELLKLRQIPNIEQERGIIERQLAQMVGLVNDLLDISRITRGTVELKRTRLAVTKLVARAIEQASPLIDTKRHQLLVDVPDDVVVHGDENRLAQVLGNLLNNAAKYTPAGGGIELQVKEDGEDVVFTVRDNGIGVEPQTAARLFDTFFREDRDHSTGGLGLGLAIVKSLVDAHSGTVCLRSDGVNKGTEVTLRLPRFVQATQDPQRTSPTPQSDTAQHLRILLVDDNKDAADLLASALEVLGHQVMVRYEPESTLAVAKTYVPHVALLDLGLPVIDGYELSRRLRRIDEWDAVRFVAVTGYGQQADRDRSHEAGFSAHLVKPVDLVELARQLDEITSAD